MAAGGVGWKNLIKVQKESSGGNYVQGMKKLESPIKDDIQNQPKVLNKVNLPEISPLNQEKLKALLKNGAISLSPTDRHLPDLATLAESSSNHPLVKKLRTLIMLKNNHDDILKNFASQSSIPPVKTLKKKLLLTPI